MLVSKKFIPSLFTILNAFCGFLSIVNASNGLFDVAAMFIIYATLFDLFDGFVARLLKTSSDFGVELDSLSDVISFGAAPSYLLYAVFFKQYGGIGIALSSLVMVFSAIRLARFNVELVGHDKEKFHGLPTPITSITLCSYFLFYHDKILNTELSTKIIFILTISLPLLMVSRFNYFTLPKISKKSFKKNIHIFIIILIAVVIIAITKGEALFLFAILYILSGIILSIIRMIFKKKPPKSEIKPETSFT
jgi:CDP-diacylglycerol---serine O-phosphatidyltransferase